MTKIQLSGPEEYQLLEEILYLPWQNPEYEGPVEFDVMPFETLVNGKPLDSPETKIEQSKKYKYLKELEDKNLIRLLPLDGSNHFQVSMYDHDKLAHLCRRARFKAMHEDGEPAEIVYNPASGRGKLNGTPFRLKGRNKKIFTVLFNNPNIEIDKGKVWRAAGRRGNPQDNNDTIILNSYLTNLRRALGGVSPKQLRLRKTVKLWIIENLTDENDLILN